jgi:hypothetical protein
MNVLPMNDIHSVTDGLESSINVYILMYTAFVYMILVQAYSVV